MLKDEVLLAAGHLWLRGPAGELPVNVIGVAKPTK